MKQKKKKETKDAEGFVEIPFGAFDSETMGWTYTIPEGFTAKIEDGKIIVEKKKSEVEKAAYDYALRVDMGTCGELVIPAFIAGAKWQERQKEQKPSERNEEDEKRFISCMGRLQKADGSPTDNSDWFEDAIERLKSLRPQPKEDIDAIAKREYERGKLDGYWEEYKKAQESMSFHYDYPTFPSIKRSCFEGGPCTNPHMDCINCPRKDGGGTYTTLPYTASGESKLESHWRPSEEQINALAKAIITLGEQGDNKTVMYLNEIRTELKKL